MTGVCLSQNGQKILECVLDHFIFSQFLKRLNIQDGESTCGLHCPCEAALDTRYQ